jgi:hypothetical protein
MDLLKEQLKLLLTGVVGATVITLTGWQPLLWPWLIFVAGAVVSWGLYRGMAGIDHAEVFASRGVIVVALTFGVAQKFAIIAGGLYWFTGDALTALLLAPIVAQIDALAVASLADTPRMSPAMNTVLKMWAFCDDPVTVLVSLGLSGLAAEAAAQELAQGDGWGDALFALSPHLGAMLLIALLFILRKQYGAETLRGWNQRLRQPFNALMRRMVTVAPWTAIAVPLLLLAGLETTVVALGLYSMMVWVGWYYCPRVLDDVHLLDALRSPKRLSRKQQPGMSLGDAITRAALLVAALIVGALAATSRIDWVGGLVLGGLAFLAQFIAAWTVYGVSWVLFARVRAEGFKADQVLLLALAQQLGITAIVLTLTTSVVTGQLTSVATVPLAILVVNGLYASSNAICGWMLDRRKTQ